MDADQKSLRRSQVRQLPLFSKPMADLFNQKNTSDVCLLIDQTPYYVHKDILSRVSPVFKELFTEESAENSEDEGDDTVVQLTETDDCLVVFPVFLRYFYCGPSSVSLKAQNVVQLLILATKYKVQPLRELCLDWMNDYLNIATDNGNLDLDVVMAWAMHGYIREDVEPQQLRQKCLEILKSHMNDVITSAKWDDLPLEYILILLQDDDLKVSDEYVLYQAVEKWLLGSDRQRAQSKNLSPILQLVRFPMMTFEQLSLIQESSALYSENKDEFQKHLEDARRFHCLKITEDRGEISRHVIDNYTRKYSKRKYTRTPEPAADQSNPTSADARETDVAIAAELLSNGFEVSVYQLSERSDAASTATRETVMPKIINGKAALKNVGSKSNGTSHNFVAAEKDRFTETQRDSELEHTTSHDNVELSEVNSHAQVKPVEQEMDFSKTDIPASPRKPQGVNDARSFGATSEERPVFTSSRLLRAVSVDSSEYVQQNDPDEEQTRRASLQSSALLKGKTGSCRTADTQTELSLLDKEVLIEETASGQTSGVVTVANAVNSLAERYERADESGERGSSAESVSVVRNRRAGGKPEGMVTTGQHVEEREARQSSDARALGEERSPSQTLPKNQQQTEFSDNTTQHGETQRQQYASSSKTTADPLDTQPAEITKAFDNSLIEGVLDISVHTPFDSTFANGNVFDKVQDQATDIQITKSKTLIEDEVPKDKPEELKESDQINIGARLPEGDVEVSRRHDDTYAANLKPEDPLELLSQKRIAEDMQSADYRLLQESDDHSTGDYQFEREKSDSATFIGDSHGHELTAGKSEQPTTSLIVSCAPDESTSESATDKFTDSVIKSAPNISEAKLNADQKTEKQPDGAIEKYTIVKQQNVDIPSEIVGKLDAPAQQPTDEDRRVEINNFAEDNREGHPQTMSETTRTTLAMSKLSIQKLESIDFASKSIENGAPTLNQAQPDALSEIHVDDGGQLATSETTDDLLSAPSTEKQRANGRQGAEETCDAIPEGNAATTKIASIVGRADKMTETEPTTVIEHRDMWTSSRENSTMQVDFRILNTDKATIIMDQSRNDEIVSEITKSNKETMTEPGNSNASKATSVCEHCFRRKILDSFSSRRGGKKGDRSSGSINGNTSKRLPKQVPVSKVRDPAVRTVNIPFLHGSRVEAEVRNLVAVEPHPRGLSSLSPKGFKDGSYEPQLPLIEERANDSANGRTDDEVAGITDRAPFFRRISESGSVEDGDAETDKVSPSDFGTSYYADEILPGLNPSLQSCGIRYDQERQQVVTDPNDSNVTAKTLMRMSEGSYLLSIIEELEDEEDSDSCHGSGRSTDEERSETAEDSQMTGRAQRDSTGDENCTDQSSDFEQRSDTDTDADDSGDFDDEGQRSQPGDDSATEDTLAVEGDTITQTTIRDTDQAKVDFPDILKEHIRKAELILQDAGDLSSEGNVKDDGFDKKAESETKVDVSRDYHGESQYAETGTDGSKSEDVGDEALTKCATEFKCDKKSLPDSSKSEKGKFAQSAGTRLASDNSRNNNSVAASGNESHLGNEPHRRDEEKSQGVGDVFADDTGVAHVTFKWTDGGESAFIAGDFTSWEESPLNYDENEKCFLGTFELSDGEHQYKYVVDGQWRLKSDEEDIHGPYGPNHVICIRNGTLVTD